MILDIFDQDAFSLVTLSDQLSRRPYVPTELAGMGIFSTQNIRTEEIAFEFGRTKVNLLQTSQRGDPLAVQGKRKRNIRKYATSRIGESTRISASELAFVRQMGTEQATVTLAQEIADRLGHGATAGILDDIDLTMENMRLGALRGKVLDKDGSIIMDWAKEFDNVTGLGGNGTIPNVVWDMNPATVGDFRTQANAVRREIVNSAGGMIGSQTTIQHLCGAEFFDDLIKVPEIAKQYDNQINRAGYVEGGGVYGSVEYPRGHVWTEYRGTDSLSNDAVEVAVDECISFPKGIKGSFIEVYSPAETFADLGTTGKPRYAEIVRDPRDRFVDLEATTYPLVVCTIPKTLRSGTKTT